MWDVDPFQVIGIMLWYAEKVQVITLLVITDLKCSNMNLSMNLYGSTC